MAPPALYASGWSQVSPTSCTAAQISRVGRRVSPRIAFRPGRKPVGQHPYANEVVRVDAGPPLKRTTRPVVVVAEGLGYMGPLGV